MFKQRKEEYVSFVADKMHNQSECIMPNKLYLDNRMDILVCLKNVLDSMKSKKNNKIYMNIKSINQEVVRLLNIFFDRELECEIQAILYFMPMKKYNSDSKEYNLKVFSEILSILMQRNYVELYCSESSNVGKCLSENWIVTQDYVLQFDEGLSFGMLSSDSERITFFMNEFQRIKSNCDNLGRKELLAEDVAYLYDSGNVVGNSFEYMPCIGNCLTKEMLEKHIHKDISGREYIIEGLIKRHINQIGNEKWKWTSIFAYEGLISFMETGNIDNFPYEIYKKPNMNVRCELLERIIAFNENGRFCYKMIKGDSIPSSHGLYVEQIDDKRINIQFYVDGGCVEKFYVDNEDVVSCFVEYSGYLEKIGYIHSLEETTQVLRKVLGEYRQRA